MNKTRFAPYVVRLVLAAVMMTLVTACGSGKDNADDRAQILPEKAVVAAESNAETDPESRASSFLTDSTIAYSADDLYTLLAPSLGAAQAGGQRGERSQRSEGGQRGNGPFADLTREHIRLQDDTIQLLNPQSSEPIAVIQLSLIDGRLEVDLELATRGAGQTQQNSPLQTLGENLVEALMNDLQDRGQNGQITSISVAVGNLEIGFQNGSR